LGVYEWYTSKGFNIPSSISIKWILDDFNPGSASSSVDIKFLSGILFQ
jgi:hypothetical protein